MMTAKTTERQEMPHPAPMSHPYGARSKVQRFHGVAARGRQGGAVWGNLGWRVHKLDAVSSLRGLQPGFPDFGTTSPYLPVTRLFGMHRFISLSKSMFCIEIFETNPLFGGASMRAPFCASHYQQITLRRITCQS